MEKILTKFSNNPILMVTVVLAVFALIPLVFWFMNLGRTQITFVVAPSITEIYIDDSRIRGTTTNIKPGTYQVEATAEGFETLEFEITVDEEEQTIPLGLVPITPEAYEIVRNDPSFLDLESSLGDIAVEEGELFRERNPIARNLPHRNLLYKIDYRSPDDESIIIEIRADSQHNRDLALSQIRNWGFNPDDFEIEFID